MTRVGVTGHRGLDETTTALIDSTIRSALRGYAGPQLVGVTCLADGADTIFARATLDLGGSIEAIIPASTYREGLPTEHHATYDSLLNQATAIHRLDREESDSEAHMAASVRMIDIVSELIAVWDGKPARGYGGTADVVSVARERGVPVQIVWPDGATRD